MTKAQYRKPVFIVLILLFFGSALSIFALLKNSQQVPIKVIRAQTSPILMLADNYSYRQDAPAWGSNRIGTTTDSLANYGCTISSVAVAASNLLKTEITPEEMNAQLSGVSGFTNRGWLIWKHVGTATDDKLRANISPKPSHQAITQCMSDEGYPIIKIKLGGQIIHWVVIVGKTENDYLIRDPLVGGPNDGPILLSSRSDYIYATRCITLAGN